MILVNSTVTSKNSQHTHKKYKHITDFAVNTIEIYVALVNFTFKL